MVNILVDALVQRPVLRNHPTNLASSQDGEHDQKPSYEVNAWDVMEFGHH